MICKYHYWVFKEVLSKKICEDIIKFAKQEKENIALVGGMKEKKFSKKQINDLNKKRNSNVVWLREKWIYDQISPYLMTANKNAGWNYQLDRSESMQFTIYKKGQHYDWHFDCFPDVYKDQKEEQLNGKIRKLSMTVSLTDPKEYKGGDFEFKVPDGKGDPVIHKCKEIKPQGSIIVFPSYIIHRVTPVTKGERNSLVVWTVGNPYV